MKFRELFGQLYNVQTGIIDPDALCRLLPTTPADVIEQFYSHHGRNSEFQAQYSELDILSINWSKVVLTASEIIQCAYYDPYSKWYKNVGERAAQFSERGWASIDTRADVVEHWKNQHTWSRAPVFLVGHLLGLVTTLWLVEGHTRVGLLCGLVRAGVIALSSEHEIWIGQSK